MDIEPCEGDNSPYPPDGTEDQSYQPLGHNSKGDLYACGLDWKPQASSAGSDGDSTEEGEDDEAVLRKFEHEPEDEEVDDDDFEELCQFIGREAADNWRQDQLDNLLSRKTRDYQ